MSLESPDQLRSCSSDVSESKQEKAYRLDIYLATVAGIEGSLIFVGSHCVDVKEESGRRVMGPGE